MPSFDIVSEVEVQEVRNAVENATRELATRFDFRNVTASFEFNDKNNTIKVESESDFQVSQLVDILRAKLLKRGIEGSSLEVPETIEHSGKTWSVETSLKQGIDTALAKKIVKLIKDSKLKVQAQIQGEQVRVTGKSRDDLQSVMALVRGGNLGQPFQFNNFRD
ncbi:YajQ family cyclic di-GMP-binding protein [Mangrovibacter yixingensis]|uniref:YajQ family cyclic di-GMP-binding protein n=1 Tax=Mangrovibacter yixingensis TaxID=1529639 RepID=UPI001CFB32E5|nr:YajQ family cyclic di-GMP-binding protein [Mangrovibacter yixingensis]